MRLTVFGGCGAWPADDRACSGYLIEQDGFRLLLDPGYAVLPVLLRVLDPDAVDAVLVSHGHPDHCADLNPLLRARAMGPQRAPRLPVYTLPGAVDAVLALDRPGMLSDAYVLHAFEADGQLEVGPFRVQTRELPHFVPNVGMRVACDDGVIAYTGDCGPDDAMVGLARGADILLAEATYIDTVPDDARGLLSSAADAGALAANAGTSRLILTHLLPGTDPPAAVRVAASRFRGPIDVAMPGLSIAASTGSPG